MQACAVQCERERILQVVQLQELSERSFLQRYTQRSDSVPPQDASRILRDLRLHFLLARIRLHVLELVYVIHKTHLPKIASFISRQLIYLSSISLSQLLTANNLKNICICGYNYVMIQEKAAMSSSPFLSFQPKRSQSTPRYMSYWFD